MPDAALRLVASGLPGEGPPPRSAIDVVLGASRHEVDRLNISTRAVYSVALAGALARTGHAGKAAELADREAMELLHRASSVTAASTESACYAALAEVYLLSGRCREASDCARIAMEYADEAADEAAAYRALGLLAASFALNGELNSAASALGSAAALAVHHDWDGGDWPSVIASAIIDRNKSDADGVRAALEALERHGGRGVLQRLVSRLGRIWFHAARGDYREMVSAARRFAHGVDRRVCPPYLLDLAVAQECLALLHLGDAGTAAKLVESRRSAEGHPVCFELYRASIALRLDDPRQALRCTDACVNGCPDHQLGSLPSVHLRRAVAHELLGHEAAADAEFSRAAHLAAEVGAGVTAVSVPVEALTRLFGRLSALEPDFARAIDDRMPAARIVEPQPLDFVPVRLTDRETVLADWLNTDLTLNAIADELHVSVNTVKTQVRSLYRKLGVTSRDDAVRVLERIGFTGEPRPA